MKPVIAQVALEVIDDLDEPVLGDITVRHVLTHTTGLPNWRPAGEALRAASAARRAVGLLGRRLRALACSTSSSGRGSRSIDLVDAHVFAPLGMSESRLDDPEPGYHGYRPLLTTAR